VNDEGVGLTTIGQLLGHEFEDPGLIELALSHVSYAHEKDGSRGNERLEFLGDAVLDLVIAEFLYDAHPDWTEGALTRARAALVNKRTLAERARGMGLGAYIHLGRTERRSGGESKDSILSNCFEAVVGALFLDGGLAPVEALARRLFGSSVEEGSVGTRRDPKTEFQEWAHARHGATPRYRTIRDSETDDDERRFSVEVTLDDERLAVGVGRTKRDAERAAAQAALEAAQRGSGDDSSG